MEEIHLLILWSKALNKKEKILSDLKEKFDILEICNVTWNLEKFSENLSRFYGENLPKNSGKEQHCGNDTFTCIIVKDNTPIYDLRETSKGSKIVNTRLFDVKQLYRKWTGGGHKIHATDDINETKLQLALLFGKDYDIYIEKYISNNEEINLKQDLVGTNGWNSFEELFKILNLTSRYVILRNFDNLDEQLNSLHPDVDLLVESKEIVLNILNMKPTTSKSYRVQYSTIVSGKKINFDLRYVGDNYYCYKWERKILNSRIKHDYYFIPNENNYLYSLIYHALIHKENISTDYINKFIELKPEFERFHYIDINLLDLLLEYMDKNNYLIVEPNDLTVKYNNKLISKKVNISISKSRKLYEYYLKQRLNIKTFIYKVKNKIKHA